MQPLQFYKYAAGLLLLLNIGVVLFVWLNRPNHRPHPLQDRIVRILDLDQQQQEKFDVLVKEHSEQTLAVDKAQQALLLPYFHSLTDNEIMIDLDTTMQQVQTLERQKIEATYVHFQQVKHLLRPEQQENYKAFMELLLGRIFSVKEDKRPPRN